MKTSTLYVYSIIKFIRIEGLIIKLSGWLYDLKKFIPVNTVYPNPTLRRVQRDGATFLLNISDYMQWHIWAGLRDVSWKLAIKKLSANNELTIIDIGSNVGAFTLKTACYMKKNHIRGKIIAFEPNPVVFKQLSANLCLNHAASTLVISEQIGISDKRDALQFQWQEKNSGGGKFILPLDNPEINVNFISVIPLDDYIESNNIKRIHFIKVDVEGFEPFVINGAKKTISKYKPDIYMEVSPVWWENNGYNVERVLYFFKETGYRFFPALNEVIEGESKMEDILKIEGQYNLFLTAQN